MLYTSPQKMLLPDYSVRVSNRAKRLILKIKPPGRVEVVVPKGMSKRHVPGFVAQNATWIEKNLRQFKQHAQNNAPAQLPTTIDLPSCEEQWTVKYLNEVPRSFINQDEQTKTITVATANEEHKIPCLQQWLSLRAKKTLPPWLRTVSEELGLPYNQVSVRGQKTRWGSCSSKKNINLNRSLLLLPPQYVRYLFIHELCHTIHLNHSAEYWALVERFESQYRQYEKALNKAAKSLPHWAISY